MKVLCPNKEVCGSCGWSHIPYQDQLAQKLSDINGSLKLKELDHVCEQIVPAVVTEHYRNRMDFVIDFEGRMGLRQKGKWWKVIDDHPCFISDKRIESLFSVVRTWTKSADLTFYDRKSHAGLLRYAVIRTALSGQALVIIVTSAPESAEEEEKARQALGELAGLLDSTSLVWSINHTITDISIGDELRTISEPGYLEEQVGGLVYRVSPHAFFQTNSQTAGVLLETVTEFAGDLDGKVLLDLYCGTGFFATALAARAKRTVGVEISSEAVADAKINAERNHLEIEYHDEKAEQFDWQAVGADVVILDPPRSGMHDTTLKSILDIKPPRIVYVSCNYKHFARELVELQAIYNVAAIRAIDMFPHTPHVELVALLERR
ncbi:23S rRNA (uracil(1939)-C(5))-methyltransferase RlmD [Oligoflexia bacterium]|nr:23S rRNA (uracil(1939)-C(5))-methyltransferase RlmD [Oligoflexia bacterium]